MQKWLLKIGTPLFRKSKFKIWARLEDIKFDALKAVEQNSVEFPTLIGEYVSTALPVHPDNYEKVYWKDHIQAFVHIHDVTVPSKNLPLVSKPTEEKNQKDEWDYPNRLWFFYSSIIATAFGWSDKRIASLPSDDALAYIQEILTEKQLEREFVWSSAEVAYSYNSRTKQSKFNSLSRPYWMRPDFNKKEPVKTVKIPKAMLPMGLIVKLNETKETEPSRDI